MKRLVLLILLVSLSFALDTLSAKMAAAAPSSKGQDEITEALVYCIPDSHCFDFTHTVPEFRMTSIVPVQKGITIIVTDEPQRYCGEGSQYDGGCAVLDKGYAVAKRYVFTQDVIDHEVLHLWLWKTYNDASHDRFDEYGLGEADFGKRTLMEVARS